MQKPPAAPPETVSATPLRLALGLVYLHFGLLKFFPDLSPAELIASQTIMRLSWFWLDAQTALFLLAIFECVIGLGFLLGLAPRWLPFLFFAHMAGTFTPIFMFPELAFRIEPFAPTLEGQYILKNLVFVAAGWTVLSPQMAIPWNALAALRHRLVPTQRGDAQPGDVAIEATR